MWRHPTGRGSSRWVSLIETEANYTFINWQLLHQSSDMLESVVCWWHPSATWQFQFSDEGSWKFKFNIIIIIIQGARGRVVAWGTMLEAGGSWVPFPMSSFDFSMSSRKLPGG
jgi:hypothetical protein